MDERLKCSFCGKSQKQVKELIAGPGVFICDECVDTCKGILGERAPGLMVQSSSPTVASGWSDPQAEVEQVPWVIVERLRVENARLAAVVTAAQEIGSAYRGDWSDFDGRTLRDQMSELSNIAAGTESLAQYRASNGLCPVGGAHWVEYCYAECAAAATTGDAE